MEPGGEYMQSTRVMIFGGCNVRGPIVRAVRPQHRAPGSNWDDVPTGIAISGVPFMTYTLGEMFQTISCYQGRRRIPSDLYGLCNIKPHVVPTITNSPLARTDVILIEPNTSIEIEFEGYFLNRAPILRILTPIRKSHPSARKLCMRWYNKGIVGMDAEARREVAELLIPLIPADDPDRELTASILRNATGRKCDVRQTMEMLVSAVDIPVGVVLYTWAYMPDGRGISWPSDFALKVRAAASELKLPVFDPRPLVERAGTAAALKEDLRHYSDTFSPVVAKPLVEFAISTAQAGVARAVQSAPGASEISSVAA